MAAANMIKSRIYEYLKHYLGEYLYGLEESQLDVAVLSGHLNFTNANFKPSKVNELFLTLGLPIHLKAGFIGKLQVKYHYMSMLSNPIEVTVDDLFLILGPVLMPAVEPAHDRLETFASDEELSEEEDAFAGLGPVMTTHMSTSSESEEELVPEDLKTGNNRNIHLTPEKVMVSPPMRARTPNKTAPGRAVATQVREDFKGKQLPKLQKQGTLSSYFHKVLKTLTLTINNLHIRYEDDIYPYLSPFACGVCVEGLSVKTGNLEVNFGKMETSELVKKPARKEVTCKDCVLRNFTVYLNPLSGMLIPTSLWEATLSSPIGIFDALPAYEIRDLILQESREKFAGSPDNLISPLSVQCFCQIENKAISVCLPLPPITVTLTSAMVASARTFLDYFVNVQLWGHMRRYRPYERVNTSPHEVDEPRWLTAKRTKLVRRWFIHALRFIRYKKKLIQLVTDRKLKLEKEKERKSRKQRYQRLLDESTEDTHMIENTAPVQPPQQRSAFSFLTAKPRIVPGTTGVDLSAAVNEYNKRMLKGGGLEVKKPPSAVDLGADFPESVVGAGFQVRAEEVKLVLSDEDSSVEGRIACYRLALDLKFAARKLVGEVQAVEVTVDVHDGKLGVSQVLKIGKREVLREELVKQGLFSKPTRKTTVIEAQDTALSASFSYIPSAFKAQGEPHPSDLMYEAQGVLGVMKVAYSHQVLGAISCIHFGFYPDETCRKNQDFAMGIIEKVNVFHKRIKTFAKDLDSRFEPINFALNFNLSATSFSLQDSKNVSLYEFTLPQAPLFAVKDEHNTRLSVFGFGLTTKNTFSAFLSFFRVRVI